MAILIGQYALTATATTLAAALGLNTNDELAVKSRCQFLSVQQNEDAVNDGFLGDSTLATTPAGVGWKFPVVAADTPPQPFRLESPLGNGIDLREIYAIGTANAANLLFIIIVY